MVMAGSEKLALAEGIGYGVCAVIVSIGVSDFLSNRGVSGRDVWRWQPLGYTEGNPEAWWRSDEFRKSVPSFLVGAAAGLLLGLLAHGYLAVLQHIPARAEIIRKSQEEMAKISGLRASYAIMAVAFDPFAAEYLFRGLLFRALDREWGGWRAVVGSVAFFAIYHPPLSWVPVALLGITSALLFKKTGWLMPSVILHMVYNAVVVLT